MSTYTKFNFTARIIGSVMGSAGWIEGLVLEFSDRFRDSASAEAWATSAMERLRVPGETWADRYVIERTH